MKRLASLALLWQCIVSGPVLDAAETPGVPAGSEDVFASARTGLQPR